MLIVAIKLNLAGQICLSISPSNSLLELKTGRFAIKMFKLLTNEHIEPGSFILRSHVVKIRLNRLWNFNCYCSQLPWVFDNICPSSMKSLNHLHNLKSV